MIAVILETYRMSTSTNIVETALSPKPDWQLYFLLPALRAGALSFRPGLKQNLAKLVTRNELYLSISHLNLHPEKQSVPTNPLLVNTFVLLY